MAVNKGLHKTVRLLHEKYNCPQYLCYCTQAIDIAKSYHTNYMTMVVPLRYAELAQSALYINNYSKDIPPSCGGSFRQPLQSANPAELPYRPASLHK